MSSSKYLQPENKENTVLCALPHGGGYHEDFMRIIIDYIQQGKYIFVSFCHNKEEMEFCLTTIKLKEVYPHIKLIFVTNSPCPESKIQFNRAIKFAFEHQECFDEMLNLKEYWKNDELFYLYLFRCASVLVGAYSQYEMCVKQFCKIARSAGIEIRNLYQEQTVDMNTILAVTHEIFDGLPVSTIRLVLYHKS